MMNTIIELLKELFQLTVLLSVLGLIGKLFLKHTLLGKIISTTMNEIYHILRGCLKITKYSGKTVYNSAKSVKNYIKNRKNSKNIKKKSAVKSSKTTQKEVVNANSNVIDFKSAKQLRHKWYK